MLPGALHQLEKCKSEYITRPEQEEKMVFKINKRKVIVAG